MKKILQAIIAMFILFGFVTPSSARNADEIKKEEQKLLYAEGETAYAAGDYTRACQAFEQLSGELPKNGQLRFNLGQCYERLGDLERAIEGFRQYLLLTTPDPTDGPEVRKRIARLRVRLAEKQEAAKPPPPPSVPPPDPSPPPASQPVVQALPAPPPVVIDPASPEVRPALERAVAETPPPSKARLFFRTNPGRATIGLAAATAAGLVTSVVLWGTAYGTCSPECNGATYDQSRRLALAGDIIVPIAVATAAVGVILIGKYWPRNPARSEPVNQATAPRTPGGVR